MDELTSTVTAIVAFVTAIPAGIAAAVSVVQTRRLRSVVGEGEPAGEVLARPPQASVPHVDLHVLAANHVALERRVSTIESEFSAQRTTLNETHTLVRVLEERTRPR